MTKSTATTAPIKGYKVFLPDFKAKEGGFQYAENKEFKHKGEIRICNSGFHFCLKASHCFSYYSFDPNNIVCEVEALGRVEAHDQDSKVCTDHIRIGRRLTWQEVLVVANEGSDNTGHSNSGNRNSGNSNSGNWNSGNWNSGYRNSGNWNSGNRNSGDWNSGNRNSGDSNSGDRNSGNRNNGDRNSGDSNSGYRNSGNWNNGDRNSGDSNSGYRNSGAFCTDQNPVLWLFNKPTDIKVRDWEQNPAMQIMCDHLETHIWIYPSSMTDEEKAANPKYEITNGYLKQKSLKEAWADMWPNLSEENKAIFINLPNFDASIFEEITGIKI